MFVPGTRKPKAFILISNPGYYVKLKSNIQCTTSMMLIYFHLYLRKFLILLKVLLSLIWFTFVCTYQLSSWRYHVVIQSPLYLIAITLTAFSLGSI